MYFCCFFFWFLKRWVEKVCFFKAGFFLERRKTQCFCFFVVWIFGLEGFGRLDFFGMGLGRVIDGFRMGLDFWNGSLIFKPDFGRVFFCNCSGF